MTLQIDILTLFPGMFSGMLAESIVGRARQCGRVVVDFTNIRDFTADRHRSVDDRPYGGGPGMVFKPEPTFAAVESVLARRKAPASATRKIILSPQGRQLTQSGLRSLVEAEWLILLSGHYEGFDERIIEGLDFEEISIGDYVLSGGEIPAMVILDGVTRLLPGVLGDPDSARYESFENGSLDYPQYTRPPVFRDMAVPEVLLSGDHAKIAAWREAEARKRTLERRRDLVDPSAGLGQEPLDGQRKEETNSSSQRQFHRQNPFCHIGGTSARTGPGEERSSSPAAAVELRRLSASAGSVRSVNRPVTGDQG